MSNPARLLAIGLLPQWQLLDQVTNRDGLQHAQPHPGEDISQQAFGYPFHAGPQFVLDIFFFNLSPSRSA